MRALVCVFLIFLVGCNKTDSRYRIVYINSYHEGYPPSDDVMRAMFRNFPKDTFDVTTFFMNTKRNADSIAIEDTAKKILSSIRSINPDLIIVSDDAAVKYIVSPYQQQLSLPLVYCGVNWSSSSYNLSPDRITGMVEVLPLDKILSFLKKYNKEFRKLTILSESSVSEERNSLLLDTLYKTHGFLPEYVLVDNFQDWKDSFAKVNETSDLIYLPTNGAISGWDDQEAREWVKRHAKVPVFTCDDFMMSYAVVGFTKVAEEQGEYVARTARRILLEKESISSMIEEKNKTFKIWLNPHLIKETNFEVSDSLMNHATIFK